MKTTLMLLRRQRAGMMKVVQSLAKVLNNVMQILVSTH